MEANRAKGSGAIDARCSGWMRAARLTKDCKRRGARWEERKREEGKRVGRKTNNRALRVSEVERMQARLSKGNWPGGAWRRGG